MLIVKTGSTNKEQEKFLGYKFSNRRGYKGIDFTGDTLMFDRANQLNPKKVNSYIYKNFIDEKIEIDEELAEKISLVRLTDCINFEKIDFDKRLNLSAESVIKLNDVFNTKFDKSLKSIAHIQKGSSITQAQTEQGDIPVVAGGQNAAYYHNQSNREPDIITVSASGAYSGFVNYWNQKIFASDCITVKSLNEKEISTRLIFHYLKSIQKQIYQLQRIEAQPHVYPKDIERIKIPVPPLDVQQNIINEIEDIEVKEAEAKKVIEEKTNEMFDIIKQDTELKKVADVSALSKDKIDPSTKPNELFNYVGLEHLESNTGKILTWEPSIGSSIKSTKNAFKKGQVLYGKLRPYLNKVVIPDFDGICSTDILVLDSEHPTILQRVLLSQEFVVEATKKMSGVNLPRIKVKDFLDMKIRYPKNPDKTIKALAKLENEIQSQEQAIANTEEKKKAILTKYLQK